MYFEEYEINQSFKINPVAITQEEIIEFAEKYDPRPIHIDPQQAKYSRFNGLIASGFHTLLATFSEWVKTGIDSKGLICGVSLDKVEWILPVYPNDTLYPIMKVVGKQDKEHSSSGHVQFELTATNQNDNTIIKVLGTALVSKQKTVG